MQRKKILFPLLIGILFSIVPFGAAAQNTGTGRIKIGFTEFTNKAKAVKKTYYGYRELQFDLEAFATMVETALVKTRRFEVIERKDLDKILAEQGLASAGVIDAETGAVSVAIRGIDFLLIGTVTKCGFAKTPVTVGRYTQEKTVIELGIDFKLTDVSTGRIVLSDFVEVNDEATSQISGGGYDVKSTSENYISNAMRKASLQSAFLIANAIEPLRIDAVQEARDVVKLNYGSGFIEKDQHYRVYPSDNGGDDWDVGFDAVGKVSEGKIADMKPGSKVIKIPPDEEAKLQDKEKLKTRDELGNRFGY